MPVVEHEDHDGEKDAWEPSERNLWRVQGEVFGTLRAGDKALIRYCGKVGDRFALSASWFLQELLDRRNAAARHAIEGVLRERAPDGRIGDYSRDGSKVADDALPRTLALSLPSIDRGGEMADATTIKVLMQRVARKLVCMEITEASMTYFRAAIRAAAAR